MSGSASSAPITDQVPELIQAKSPRCPPPAAGTAATAEPVSWLAGAMIGTGPTPSSAARAVCSGPSTVPAGTTSGKMPVGISRAARSGPAQASRRGS